MKTDQLIELLARGAGPAPRALAAQRLWPAGLLGSAAAAMLALAASAPVAPELLSAPGWWRKLGYVLLLAVGAGWWLARLGRPATSGRLPRAVVIAVVAGMALIGLAEWLPAAPDQRLALLKGHSWATCTRNVLLLSLPALGGVFWALRGLAPTRLPLCGAVAGAFAGAVGAVGYTVICSEVASSFVAVWYTLGIAAVAAVGAFLGPRLLRW